MYYYIFFKYLFCAKAAPMLVLVTCVEKDDVTHWVVKHKTRWYLSLVTTDCDILDLENCLLKGKCDVSWHNSKGIKKICCLSPLITIPFFPKWRPMKFHEVHRKGRDVGSLCWCMKCHPGRIDGNLFFIHMILFKELKRRTKAAKGVSLWSNSRRISSR